MNDSTLSYPPMGAADLPGAAPGSYRYAPPLLERLPDRIATRALVVVALGGFAAQVLFYGQSLGLNLPIWAALVLGAGVLVRRKDAHFDRADAWLPVAALLFASFCSIRTDGMLMLFDVPAVATLTLASIVAIGGQPITRAPWHSVLSYAVRSVFVYLFGAAHLRNAVAALPRSRTDRQTVGWRIARGLVLAVPLVLVFVVLFAGADAVFDSIVRRLLPTQLDSLEIIGRSVVAVAAAWLLGGAVSLGWLTRETYANDDDASGRSQAHIGEIEALVILGAIDVVFVFFVVLQGAYLFGGLDTLAAAGISYSDYARRGFGELIAASVLVGIVLVTLGNLTAARGRAYRLLGAMLCLATAVVVISAFMRITLYQQAYGWTELRFYTVAGIGWLAIGAAIALVGVITDRIGRLTKVGLLAGFAVAATCNLVGPQAFVTDQNVARAIDPSLVAPGGESGLDVGYLSSLDADAIRVLAMNVNRLPEPERTEVDGSLRYAGAQLLADQGQGWPSWNLARQSASDALTYAGY